MPRSEHSKIVLLLDSSGLGGIETHVANLATSFRSRGEDCHVLFLADHGTNLFHRQLRELELPFSVLDGRPRSLGRWLWRERPRVLHTHGYKAGLIGRLTATVLGIPTVSTFHAGERAPFPVGLYQHLDEWTSFLAPRIAVSAPIAGNLPFHAELIPNFIRIPAALPIIQRTPRIAFVGRLSQEKAPDRFCALARAASCRAEFHIYGDGPMRPELESKQADFVRFHGFRADMASVWPEIDLLVIPSRAEGLPMVALEAIARGIPLIATDVGALATVIGEREAGWLIPAEPERFSLNEGCAAIEHWLDLDPAARQRLSESARARAIREFSEEPALSAIQAVYRRAAR